MQLELTLDIRVFKSFPNKQDPPKCISQNLSNCRTTSCNPFQLQRGIPVKKPLQISSLQSQTRLSVIIEMTIHTTWNENKNISMCGYEYR